MNARQIGSHQSQLLGQERGLIDALRTWLRGKNGRDNSGVIMLVQHDDGFSIEYVGSEQLSHHELVGRVRWIADQLSEADTKIWRPS